MGLFGDFFGSSRSKDNKLVDANYIENIINESNDEPLAVSEDNVMYAGYNELGGYYFFQTAIFGKFKIKTKGGAKLIIEGDGYTFNLNSDMPEFASENALSFEGCVTKIDFEIEKATVENIKKSTLKSLTLITKKNKISFAIYNK